MKLQRIARTLAALAIVLAVPRGALADDPAFALRFDGVSDFVRLSQTASMMAPGWQTTKSVSLWVKPTGSSVCTSPDPGSCDALFGDRPRTWGISRGTIAGSDRIWVWNYDGTFDRIGIEYTPGEWIQVALVHGDGLLSAYKNGVLVGSIASGTTPTVSGTVLHFGGIINNASKNWTFEGEIDEVRLWNVAQTQADIQATLYTQLVGNETGLAAYYRMSNGSGTSVTDDSGHSWTGTLNDGGSGVPADGPITWVFSGAFGGTLNTPPVADPQSVDTLEDTPVAVTLTGSDADEDDLTFRVVSQPAMGSLSGTAPSLVYTPAPNFFGVMTFTFVANDGLADSSPATVTVTMAPVDDPPVAQNDSATTQIDQAVMISVLTNDLEVDGELLTVISTGAAANGVVTHDSTTVTYTPAPGFTGVDSFTYSISDPHNGQSTAQVTVTVTPEAGSGYALRFDGLSDYVKLHETANILAPGWQNTKTVELWVRPTGSSFCNAPAPGSCDAIFGDRPRWWGISRGVIGGFDRIWVWNWDGQQAAVPVTYNVGEWVHIALVHGGGVMSVYKNGVLVGSVTSGMTQQPLTGALPILHFGGIINTVSRNWTFQGDIDEVRLWDTARTAQEINQYLNLTLQGTEFGLAAYYRMSNGSGTILTDDSGQGWNGQLHDGGQGVPPDGPIQWVAP